MAQIINSGVNIKIIDRRNREIIIPKEDFGFEKFKDKIIIKQDNRLIDEFLYTEITNPVNTGIDDLIAQVSVFTQAGSEPLAEGASTSALQTEGNSLLTDIRTKVIASEVKLNEIEAKIPVNPAVENKQDDIWAKLNQIFEKDTATETTLDLFRSANDTQLQSILDKLITAPSTKQGQELLHTANMGLGQINSSLVTALLASFTFVSKGTGYARWSVPLATIGDFSYMHFLIFDVNVGGILQHAWSPTFSIVGADLVVEIGNDRMIKGEYITDYITITEGLFSVFTFENFVGKKLAEINTKTSSTPATSTLQTSGNVSLTEIYNRIGEISATPTLNTLQERLKSIQAYLDDLTGNFDVVLSSVATQTTLSLIEAQIKNTTINSFNKTVAIAQNVEALAGSTACKWVMIVASLTNTGTCYVGGSDINSGSGIGLPLEAGDSITLQIDNLSKVYISPLVAGEGVTVTYFN